MIFFGIAGGIVLGFILGVGACRHNLEQSKDLLDQANASLNRSIAMNETSIKRLDKLNG